MNEEELKAFKDSFKRKPEEEKAVSVKTEKKYEKTDYKKYLPYLYVFFGFIFVSFITVVIIDSLIIPSMVHKSRTVQVPSVTSLPLEEAITKLQRVGLKAEVSTEQYSETIPENIIVKQNPNPDIEVKEGRVIYLSVSKGKQKVEVPSLIGRSVRYARIELMKRGLELGNIEYENSENFPRDTIMEQSIKAFQKVKFGAKINIKVSSGSELKVAVPVLIGVKLEEVEILLRESNLQLGNVIYRDSQTFLPNVVIETFPQQYEMVQQGSFINVVISK